MSQITEVGRQKDDILDVSEVDDFNDSNVTSAEVWRNFSGQSEELPPEEHCKLPLWFANRKKDIFAAEHWIESVEKAKLLYNWDNETTIFHVCTALRDGAVTWFNMLESDGVDWTNWEQIKKEFLESYGTIIQGPEDSPDFKQGI